MSAPRPKPAAVGVSDVRLALLDVKSSMQALLSAVPGLQAFRPVDIEQALGIDLKLAWKVSHLAHAGDPFDAVRHLPGDVAGAIVAAAAGRRGVPVAITRAFRTALDRAQTIGIAWAGGKRAFSLLSANLANASDGRFAAERRRELFHGGMHVWGMRAARAFRVDVLHPSSHGSSIDCLTVRGFVDLERLRFDAAWRLESPRVVDDRGRPNTRSVIEAPVGASGDQPPFLVPGLCQGSLPPLGPGSDDRSVDLSSAEIGRASTGTVVQAAIMRRVQPRRPKRDYSGIFQVFRLRTPSEAQEFIVGVHRDLVPEGVQPDVVVYSDLYGAPDRRVPYQLGDRLHCGASIEPLSARARLRVAGAPGLDGWMNEQLAVLGWSRPDVLWFRASVEYPPIPSTLVVQMPQAD